MDRYTGKIKYGEHFLLLQVEPEGVFYEFVYVSDLPYTDLFFIRQIYYYQRGRLDWDVLKGLCLLPEEEKEWTQEAFLRFSKLLGEAPLLEDGEWIPYLRHSVSGTSMPPEEE